MGYISKMDLSYDWCRYITYRVEDVLRLFGNTYVDYEQRTNSYTKISVRFEKHSVEFLCKCNFSEDTTYDIYHRKKMIGQNLSLDSVCVEILCKFLHLLSSDGIFAALMKHTGECQWVLNVLQFPDGDDTITLSGLFAYKDDIVYTMHRGELKTTEISFNTYCVLSRLNSEFIKKKEVLRENVRTEMKKILPFPIWKEVSEGLFFWPI